MKASVMAMNKTELAALIGSRICHDLVSPVGAISGGLELVEMTGQADGPEMALIRESLESALTRIKYFRIAFGGADDQQFLAKREVMAALQDKSGKITFDYQIEDEVSRTELRLAFLAANCLEHAFAMGGSITLEFDGEEWTLRGEGKRMRMERRLWDYLRAGEVGDDIVANEVQFALLAAHCSEAGRSIEVEIDEEANVITLDF